MRNLYFFMGLFFSCGFCVACPIPPSLPSNNEMQELYRLADDKGVLLRGVRGDSTIWLYGTVHFNNLENAIPGPRLLHAINTADSVFLEIDSSDPNIKGIIAGELDEGPLLSDENRFVASELALDLCLSPEIVERPAPRVIQTLFQAKLMQFGLSPDFSSDLIVRALALNFRKNVNSLESPIDQYSVILDSRDTSIASAQLQSIRNNKVVKDVNDIVKAWVGGDTYALRALAENNGALDAQMAARNILMTEKIISYIRSYGDKDSFVAVGVFHLVGEQGLVNLLTKAGYEFSGSSASER